MDTAAPAEHAGRQGWHFYLILACASLLLLVACALLEARMEVQSRARILASVEQALVQEASHFADSLHERASHYETISAIGDFITMAVVAGDTRLRDQSLARLRAIVEDPDNGVIHVGAIDAKGMAMWTTSTSPDPEIDYTDREHYRAIAIEGRDQIFGRPVLGRLSHRVTVQHANATRDGGTLLGITVVSIDPSSLVSPLQGDYFDRHLAGAHRYAARTDGTLIAASARAPALPALPLDQIAPGSNIVVRAAKGGDAGLVIAVARNWGSDLVALTAMPVADVDAMIAPALRQNRMVAGVAAGGIVAIAILLALAWRNHLRVQRTGLQAATAAEGFARLRELAENIREVVIVWRLLPNRTRVFEYVSPQCERELSIPAEEMVRNPRLLKPHPEDADKMRERTRLLVMGQMTRGLEYRFLLPDGSVRWVDITSRPIAPAIENGVTIPRFITCLHNVTELHQLQEQLRETNRRLEDLTTESPCVLYTLEGTVADGQFKVTSVPYVSRSLYRLAGYQPQQFTQIDSMAKVLQPESVLARVEMMSRAVRDEEATCDYPIRKADGKLMWVRDMVRVSERRVGTCILSGFAVDITREKEFSSFLDEASKLASLGEMAAGIAHELHQPLAAISLNVELIGLELPEGAPHAARVRERLDKIAGLVDRSANVIRHIREFSRSEAADTAPLDVGAAIEAVAEIMAQRLRHGGCALHTDSPRDAVLRVSGHTGPFEQVLINLVGNAVDAYGTREATGTQPHRITIKARAIGDEVAITVADHAGGIPDAVMPRIFEPFFTTKDVNKGTGLGLSICRRIVNEMGGTIDAANADDGAVFTVRLPKV